jgi:hypothetical protein
MLQSPRPAAQRMAHVPDVHTAVPPTELHVLPQRPQWVVLDASVTSHPLVATPSQSAKPVLHTNPQVEDEQVVVALVRAGHTVAHAPQFETSVARFTQLELQLVSPIPHTNVHTPPEHTCGDRHTVPHVPQWVALVLVLASQPLEATPSQF